MTPNIKFYKIKLLKELIEATHNERAILLGELIDHAIDPTVFKRRIRMIKHLNIYESQLIQKIQDFDTDDVRDFEKVFLNPGTVVNRNA
jgi:hypothetical protein